MGSVEPLNYTAIKWAIEAINRCLMQRGVVLQVAVDKDNDIQDVLLVSVQEALERGFNPIALLPQGPGNPEPPRTANG